MNKASYLELDHISVVFSGKEILHDISLSVQGGEFLSIIGPNGCGKSTLLKVMCHMLEPVSGKVLLDGKPVRFFSRRRLARRMAILTQKHVTPDDMTVQELVSLGRFPYRNFYTLRRSADLSVIKKVLAVTGLTNYAERLVHTLSGGEQQRAWLAMTLAQEPQILLLDEPTTYLDIRHQLDILQLLQRLNQQLKLTIVIVLHDMNQALQYSSRTVVIKNGTLVADGLPEAVITPQMLKQVFAVNGELAVTPSGKRVLVV